MLFTRISRFSRLQRRLKRKTEKKTWFFAFFKGGDRLPWWCKIFVKDGYNHVLSFAQAGNFVVILDPIHSHTVVDVRYHPEGADVQMPAEAIACDFVLNGGARVFKYEFDMEHDFTSHHVTNCLPGCVTLAKDLMGKALWVFTPDQMIDYLIYNGSREYTQSICEELLDGQEGFRR